MHQLRIANTTQQLAIDVGDMPGHQVRVYRSIASYPPSAKPNCKGLKETESWTHGFSDYVDRNGRTWGYTCPHSKTATRCTGSIPRRSKRWSGQTARKR